MRIIPATSPRPTLRQQRSLLSHYSDDEAAVLQAWFDAPSPDAPPPVADLLASKAQHARPLAHVWKDAANSAILDASVVSLLFLPVYLSTAPKNLGMLYGFLLSPLFAIPFRLLMRLPGRRSAIIATLLLARIGDARAVLYLARLWTPRPLTRREATLNADVSRELARLLSEREGERFDRETETALRRVIERAFPAGRLRRVLRPRRDVSETDADLLLGIVRHLTHDRSQKAPRGKLPADEALRRIASVAVRGPNDDLLRDTTRTLLRAGSGRQS